MTYKYDKYRETRKAYRESHKEQLAETGRRYRALNHDKCLATWKAYRENMSPEDKQRVRTMANKRRRLRYATDPEYRALQISRARAYAATEIGKQKAHEKYLKRRNAIV